MSSGAPFRCRLTARLSGWRRTTVAWGGVVLALTLTSQVSAQTVPADRVASPAASAADVASFANPDIERAVVRQLGRDRHLVATGIQVVVRDGIVQLVGTVPVSSWRSRAARVAGVVRGVRAVVNRIATVPVRRADALIVKEVLAALRTTAALASLPMKAHVDEGIVELTGSISTWEQQQLAERVALSVPGVRFCQNQLVLGRFIKRTPALLAGDVRTRLDWDPLLQQASIRVSVRSGRVSLAGAVGTWAARRRVISHAWVKSVTAVDAKALVVDARRAAVSDIRSTWPTDSEIARAISDLAPYWPNINAANLTTLVSGGVVTLQGIVQTLAEKRAAEEMARSAVGVIEVKSELRGPWWRPPPVPAPPPQPPPTKRKRALRGR